jgi:hypothetical protein
MPARTQDAGVLAPHSVGRAAIEPLNQRRDRQGWWVGDAQMDVVGFAVELDQLGIELGTHSTHGVLATGEHLAGEHRPAIVGHDNKLQMQQRHIASRTSVGLVCQWCVLRCGCADG